MRKIRKITFLIIAIFVSGCASKQVDWFFVERASFAEVKPHQVAKEAIAQNQAESLNDEFVITGHRISKGDGIIIAQRIYSPGTPLLTDQATFQKLTIFLPISITNSEREISITERGVLAFWSRGLSNFPGKSGCFGYPSSGSIIFKPISNGEIAIDLNAIFNTVSPGGWKKDCGLLEVRDNVIIKKKEVKTLNPWEGSIGKNIYEESLKK